MNKNCKFKKIIIITLVLLSILSLSGCGNYVTWEEQREIAAETLLKEVSSPQVGSTGGEWTIDGIRESGIKVPNTYFDSYYDSVRAITKKKRGSIGGDKFTTYARVAITLNKLGKDAKNVEGYNLLQYLDDKKGVTDQGLNACIYALIASKECDYPLKNEEFYLKELLEAVKPGGVFQGDMAEVDYLGMTLQAFKYYKDRADVKDAIKTINTRIDKLADKENKFSSSEATAQVILGKVATDQDVTEYIDGLMDYATDDGFSHLKGGNTEIMPTEQALMALNSIYNQKKSK